MEGLKLRLKRRISGLGLWEIPVFGFSMLSGAWGTASLSPLGPAAACGACLMGRYGLGAFAGAALGALVGRRWAGLAHTLLFALARILWRGRSKGRDELAALVCSGAVCFPFFYISSLRAAMEGLAQISMSLISAAAFYRSGRAMGGARQGRRIGDEDMPALLLAAGAICAAASGMELWGVSLGGVLGAFMTVTLCCGAGICSVALGAVAGAGVVLGGGGAAFAGAAAIGALGACALRSGGRPAACCGFLALGAFCAYYGGAPEAAMEIGLGTAACALLPDRALSAVGAAFRFGKSEAEQRLDRISCRMRDAALSLDRVSVMFDKSPKGGMGFSAGEQFRHVGEAIYGIWEPEEGPVFGLDCGAASRPREGCLQAGDSMAIRELGRGKLLILSDGMGSGPAARRESSAAVSLVGDLMSIGIGELDALDWTNRLLMSENGYDMYATIDVMAFDYGSGQARFLKSGAPPSFILRRGDVIELTAETLPVGIVAAAKPAWKEMRLEKGDSVIMATDGVTDALDRGMALRIAKLGGHRPEEMARELLAEALSLGGTDDMSVIVARVC